MGCQGLGLDHPLPVYPCLLFPSYVFCWPGVGDGNIGSYFFLFYFAFGKMRACVLTLKHFGILGLVVCFVAWEGFCFLQQPFAFFLSFARCICLTLIYIHEMAKHHGCHVCRRSIAIIFAFAARPFFPKALAHPLSLIHNTPHTEHYISFVPEASSTCLRCLMLSPIQTAPTHRGRRANSAPSLSFPCVTLSGVSCFLLPLPPPSPTFLIVPA